MIVCYSDLPTLQSKGRVPKTALTSDIDSKFGEFTKTLKCNISQKGLTELTESYTHDYDLVQGKDTGQKSTKGRDAQIRVGEGSK